MLREITCMRRNRSTAYLARLERKEELNRLR